METTQQTTTLQSKQESKSGSGWVNFAGTLLMVGGVFSILDGIAAVSKSSIYTADAQYVISNLNTWGWTLLVIGALQTLIAFGVFARNGLAMVSAVTLSGLAIFAELFAASRYPLWSLILIFFQILIIYGIVAYGFQED